MTCILTSSVSVLTAGSLDVLLYDLDLGPVGVAESRNLKGQSGTCCSATCTVYNKSKYDTCYLQTGFKLPPSFALMYAFDPLG